jgi:adenylate cyclase
LQVGLPAQPKPAAPPEPAKTEAPAPQLALPDKPSIAVLPFQNMSGDAEQEYFVDGMVEDIITGLSRIKWLFVIARNSSFTYKGKAVDIRQVGRELGVRYVLEGGVRKAADQLRITAQLIEAETGAHLWADRFDGSLDDVFELQDQITDKVIGIVEPSLQRSEIERSRRTPPDSPGAYDLYLQALPHMATRTPDEARIAAGFLRDALKLEPDYGAAHAVLAWCHQICFLRGGFNEDDKKAAVRHARAVVDSGCEDAGAIATAAVIVAHMGKDYSAALSTIARALSLNASSALAHLYGAHLHAIVGHPAAATSLGERGLRLSPFDPMAFEAHGAFGLAAIQEGRFEEAVSNFCMALQMYSRFSTFQFFMAASLALAGRVEEAKPVVGKLRELTPDFHFRMVRELGFVPAILDKVADAARLLGIPD